MPGAGRQASVPRQTAGVLDTLLYRSRPMAGSQAVRRRGGGVAAAIAVASLTFAFSARAQYPSPTPAATPAPDYSDIFDAGAPPAATPIPTAISQPSYYPRTAPAPTRVVTGPLDTIAGSLFGKPDPNTWRPLPFSTFFRE